MVTGGAVQLGEGGWGGAMTSPLGVLRERTGIWSGLATGISKG